MHFIAMMLPLSVWPIALNHLKDWSIQRPMLLLIGSYLFVIVVISALISPIVRRLHDSNRSGWHLFISAFSPYLIMLAYAGLFGDSHTKDDTAPIWAMLVVMIMPFWLLFLTLIQKGDTSSNRYGEPDE